MEQIAEQIMEAPAEGIRGIAVKLALYRHEEDFITEPAIGIVRAAYEAVAQLAGFDPVAQVERW